MILQVKWEKIRFLNVGKKGKKKKLTLATGSTQNERVKEIDVEEGRQLDGQDR